MTETARNWRSYGATHRSPGTRRKPTHRVHTRHAIEREQGVQSCSRCQQLKPLDAFGVDKRSGKPRSWCRPCQAAATREWKERNRSEYLEGKRRARQAAKARGSELGR